MNETLRTVAGRWVLRIERRLAHPPEKVWRAVTEPAHLTQWFPADLEMDFRVAGRISFVFRDNEGPPSEGVVTELDPPHVFAFSWANDLLRWELRPDGDGCLLVFTHTFDDKAGAGSFAAGWQICLDALEPVLDGRLVESSQDWAELHEAYVESFGLAEGGLEVTADGWQVRFERQLIRPVDEVWATLNESGRTAGAPAVGDPVPEAFTNPIVRAGTITAIDAPTLLEYGWQSHDRRAGRVRWVLSDGNGGARLVLTQTGPSELAGDGPAALAAWRTRIGELAEQLRLEARHRDEYERTG